MEEYVDDEGWIVHCILCQVNYCANSTEKELWFCTSRGKDLGVLMYASQN